MGLSHLDDMVLNEYLDGALPVGAAEGVEAHLAICPLCTVRLAEVQQLFTALSSLPDEPAPHDLVSEVLDRLDMAQQSPPSYSFSTPWGALFIAEALAGIVCLVWLWSFLDVQVPTLSWQSFAQVFMGSLNFLQSLRTEWIAIQQSIEQLYFSLSGLYGQVPALEVPERWLIVLIPIGAAVWAASNVLLLRSRLNPNHGGNNEQQ
jgi:hypothetical protein